MMSLRSYDNLMVNSIDRIRSGFYFDENYHPYSKEFLNSMISYFQDKEDYESCQVIKIVMDKRFNHDGRYSNPF